MDDPFNLSFLDDFDDDDKHQNDFSHRTDIPESEVMLHLEDLNLSNDLISYLNEQEIFRIDHLFKLNKDFFSSLIYNLGDEAVRQLFDNIAIHEIDIPNLNQIYLQLQNDMYPNGMKSIDEMIGIAAVKEQMKNFTAHCSIQKLKNEFYGREKSLIPNMIFYGNPGTGKTTAAKLVAKKFKELGLLPKGHLVSVTRSDLVAEYTGQSAQKTTSVFKSAIGGVLFIDEAYSLFHQLNHNHYGDVFSLEVIDTLTGLITVNAGRICVILAGYEEEMTFMLEKANPGLKERFPFKFYFEDYTVVELVEIFKLQAKKITFALNISVSLFLQISSKSCQETRKCSLQTDVLLKICFKKLRYIRNDDYLICNKMVWN
jgi:SpoVK/Ycf46/Vps4 family AAA+-type ATPase